MVESMKQVSENYLSTEKGYADDWAAYISSCHMTAEEALDYIRTTNTQEDRAAHLVDMADLSARPYLLLRLIPVEYLQNTWTFPTEFPLAEISMIIRDGG